MPGPTPHFRFAMGEYEVETHPVVKELSKGLWEELQMDPNQRLDRLSLGSDEDFWSVSIDSDGPYSICNMDSSLAGQIHKLEESWDHDDFLFVSLGPAGTFSYHVGGATYTHSKDPALKAKQHLARSEGKTVQRGALVIPKSVILSPYTTTYWFTLYNDGSYNGSLPANWWNTIRPYLLPEHSLIRRPQQPAAQPPAPLPVRSPAAIQPPQALTPLRRIASNSTEYKDRELFLPIVVDGHVLRLTTSQVARLLLNGWLHPLKGRPWPVRIYAIDLPPSLMQRYDSYRYTVLQNLGINDLNEQKLFHGTPRRCCIGDPENTLLLCSDSTCNLCLIIRTSFKLERAGTALGRNFMRFGRGLYTTSVSSKADDYNVSQNNTEYKAMLVAKVVLGRSYTLYKNAKSLTDPPPGYQSIAGEVGEDLTYDEQVVYHDEAIRPAYLIIYEV
ncbi:hypothetical protein FRB96_009010 [Tulasnella sp. 330]|nr:hypothetical protein FRB96_009010 [Tulasnella sp. 330]